MTIRERIESFIAQYPNSEYGPAHVVLSDYNLEDDRLDSAIGRLERGEGDDRSKDEVKATVEFLKELRALPEGERCAEFD